MSDLTPQGNRDLPKLQPLVREISWAKNLVVLRRCKDDLEREFCLRATPGSGGQSCLRIAEIFPGEAIVSTLRRQLSIRGLLE
jgi:hypothetical protein